MTITDDDVPAVTVSFGRHVQRGRGRHGGCDGDAGRRPEREVTIPIVKADQGGASEDDYSGVPESVVFGAAETEKSFTFTAAAKTTVDDDGESVKLTFGTLPDGRECRDDRCVHGDHHGRRRTGGDGELRRGDATASPRTARWM